MAKKHLNAGIIFNVQGPPPTKIPPLDIKNITLIAESVTKSSIKLNFSIEIDNAYLSTSGFDIEENDLKKLGHVKFINALSKNIKIEKITQKLEQNTTDPVDFQIMLSIPDGKIGGAGF